MDANALIELSQDLICTVDDKGKFTFVNQACLEIFGFTPEEIFGQSFYDFIRPDDIEKTTVAFVDLLAGKKLTDFENHYYHKNGSVKYISWKAALNSKEQLIYAIGRDITESKLSAQQIYESEQRFKSLYKSAEIAVGYYTRNGEVIFYNDLALKQIDKKSHEVVGKNILELFPKKGDVFFKRIKEVSKTKRPKQYEDKIELGGSSYWFLTVYSCLENEDEKIRNVQVISIDITERIKAESALRKSTQLLEATQSIARVGGWELDVATNNLFWTAETYRIHDTTPKEFNPTLDAGVGYFLPKSRSIISKALEAALMSGKGYDLELETHTTKGRLIYVRTTCEVTVHKGKPTKLTGTFQDITDNKQVEIQLKASNKREKELADIVRESPMAIAYGYPDGRLGNCNAAFSMLTGYSDAELKQVDWNEVLTPDKWKTFEGEQLSQLSHANHSVRYEKEYIHKRGHLVPIELLVTAKYDDDRNVLHYIAFITDISERKRTEELLLEREKLLNETGQLAKVGGWRINLKGQTLAWTDETFRIHELDSSKQPGVNNAINFYHPDDRGMVGSAVQRTVDDGTPFDFEARLITALGNQIWVRAKGHRESKNGDEIFINGIIQDVTVRKLTEDALIQNQKRYEKAQAMGHVGNWEYDTVTTKFWQSDEAKRIYGFELDDDDPTTEKVANCIPERERVNQAFIDLTEKNIPYDLIIEIITHDKGIRKTIHSIAETIRDPKGNVIKITGVVSDITKRKQAETDLKKAKERAEESDLLKTAFLTNMSHEIRTPLNAVLGFSELLTKKDVSENDKEMFSEYIRLNGQGLAKIIDDIIDISKLQSKQLTISQSNFNLNTLFNELHNYYDSVLVQKSKSHIKLILDLPEVVSSDFFIESDEQRLKQILNNLISNAIKYSEKGAITFGCKIANKELHFFVKDTGFGIAPENLAHIFDRFVQFSPQYISKQEGTGLGLSICKNLVTLLGGELKVESKVNEGSEFFFQIPLVQVAKPPKQEGDLSINKLKDLSNYSILIADDEDSNYVLTKRILKSSKVTTDWAQNGKHAVEMAANNNYDLILMDIKMPEMDGIEATRLIKKQNKNIPIIIQTAFAMKEIKDEAVEAGCDGFIVKPIALDAFMELVNKHVK